MYIYVAGPLFNTHERWYLEQITAALERGGHRTFLPHRDAGVIEMFDLETRTRVFRADMKAVDECDAIVALLTGADHDSGTCGELGYAYAKGKICIGITDDGRRLNNLIWGLCGEGQHIVSKVDEVPPLLEKLAMTKRM